MKSRHQTEEMPLETDFCSSFATSPPGAARARVGKPVNVRASVSVVGVILALNLVAWALLLGLSRLHPMLISLGVLAYGFGLRHAVDADHIAAIDNITRKLLEDRRNPTRVGMYFSLGHSTIVLVLCVAIVFAVHGVKQTLPHLAVFGTWIGTGVSASFLYLIGLANFLVFWKLWMRWRGERRSPSSPDSNDVQTDSAQSDEYLWNRGIIARLLQRPMRLVQAAWQTYFIGLLFGLGFDTATEVGLLAISGSAVNQGMPGSDTLVLPLMFAAGMSLVDGADGVLMMHAYHWTSANSGRRVKYNLVITGLSVLVAVTIGTFEWMQMIFA